MAFTQVHLHKSTCNNLKDLHILSLSQAVPKHSHTNTQFFGVVSEGFAPATWSSI